MILHVERLTKRFGALVAVKDATLSVPEGSITGLIGPNGAGKTTLFAMAAGFLPTDSGTVQFAGRDVTALAPHERASLGMARTFQIMQPFAGLSVRENIAVGVYAHTPRRADAMAYADEVGRTLGIEHLLEQPAGGLTVVGRKRLELARALATRPKLLLLDEVLSGLNPSEIRDIIPMIRAIRDTGITILMIEHIMQAVMNLCENVYVLAHGEMIAEGAPAEVCENPHVIEAYLGSGATGSARGAGAPRPPEAGKPILELRDARAGYGGTEVLRGVDLDVAEGEIVAVLGSNGVGKTTLNMAISGVIRLWSGTISLAGREIQSQSSAAIVAAGLVHVPEGRRIFPNLTIEENLELGGYRGSRDRRAALMKEVYETFPRLEERRRQLAGTLSGGEQQMLAIGRGLMSEPRLLILDEPSLGLSPLLVEEMFALIKRLAERGLTIMLVEQNVVQSLEIASRAYILENGRVVKSGDAAEMSNDPELRRAYLGL